MEEMLSSQKKSISYCTKPDDKFFSGLVSEESCRAEASLRVYYGEFPGAVPFTWETRPGTPRHTLFPDDYNGLPPLTPPPSYYYSPSTTTTANKKPPAGLLKMSYGPRSKLIRRLYSGFNLNLYKEPLHTAKSLSSASSLSSLSWSSSYSSSFSLSNGRRRLFSWGFSFDDVVVVGLDEQQQQQKSGCGSFKCSRFCFPLRRKEH